MPKAAIVIPARYGSSRFEGKPLALLLDKPMIQHVYERCIEVSLVSKVIVATDDERIQKAVISFGGEVLMTSPNHNSGTSRIAELLPIIKDYDIIVNVQGDEPMIKPGAIETLLNAFVEEDTSIATLCNPISKEEELFNYNVVKVVRDTYDNALYFSRQAIPSLRDVPYRLWLSKAPYYKHVGIYAYKSELLGKLSKLPEGSLSKLEMLEQLTWLEHGYKIKCLETSYESIGVDTEEDLQRVEEILLTTGMID
jgi:3-deoxy-manno-octulosonate cytidylyltransferase (CMP-KDO synthetase)